MSASLPYPPRGYIALLCALILSAFLLVFVFAANTDAFDARRLLLQEEDYRTATYAAESCIAIAIHSISIDQDRFASSSPITIPLSSTTSCVISYVRTQGFASDIEVEGSAGASTVVRTAHISHATGSTPLNVN